MPHDYVILLIAIMLPFLMPRYFLYAMLPAALFTAPSFYFMLLLPP